MNLTDPQSIARFIDEAEATLANVKDSLPLFADCSEGMIRGTYVQIAPFHLQRYADEEAFRFNNRKTGDQARFDAVMKTTAGRRITYRQLCEIDGCGFMGLQ